MWVAIQRLSLFGFLPESFRKLKTSMFEHLSLSKNFKKLGKKSMSLCFCRVSYFCLGIGFGTQAS